MDATSKIRLQKLVTSTLQADSLYVWFSQFAHVDKIGWHVGEAEVVRAWGQLLANSQWGTEALASTAHWELNFAINYVNLEADLSLVEP